MKNADKPAMPVTSDGFPYEQISDRDGLTKREMIAMHISGHVMQSLNNGASNGEWDYPSWEELAEQTVQYTEALLKELEKQHD